MLESLIKILEGYPSKELIEVLVLHSLLEREEQMKAFEHVEPRQIPISFFFLAFSFPVPTPCYSLLLKDDPSRSSHQYSRIVQHSA
jgi:hypothetical protein